MKIYLPFLFICTLFCCPSILFAQKTKTEDVKKKNKTTISIDMFDIYGNLAYRPSFYTYSQRITFERSINTYNALVLSPSYTNYYAMPREEDDANNHVYELLLIHKIYNRDKIVAPTLGYYFAGSYFTIDEWNNFSQERYQTTSWYYGGGIFLGIRGDFYPLTFETELGLGMGEATNEELLGVVHPQYRPIGLSIAFYASFFNINLGFSF